MSVLDSLENLGQRRDGESGQGGRSWVWGLPLVPWTRAEAVEAVITLIEAGRPSFFITANLHYAMLSNQSPELQRVNDRAAFLLADGTPLVWASRWQGVRLPERVAGSDLIFDLCEEAAARGLGVFLLGGPAGVAEEASLRLQERYSSLRVVGTACPPHRPLSVEEQSNLTSQIREARPDLLFVAFGQPKGELWIDQHLESLKVPVSVQIGASLEFVNGRIRRAPRWMQRSGLEWAYRTWLEPRRLAPRYARNAFFLLNKVLGDLRRATFGQSFSALKNREFSSRR